MKDLKYKGASLYHVLKYHSTYSTIKKENLVWFSDIQTFFFQKCHAEITHWEYHAVISIHWFLNIYKHHKTVLRPRHITRVHHEMMHSMLLLLALSACAMLETVKYLSSILGKPEKIKMTTLERKRALIF